MNCLEQVDENGEHYWWSIKELGEEVQRESGTVHYHLNPFMSEGVIEVGHPRKSHLTPVYRIKPNKFKEYLELKKSIMAKKTRVYKRTKLRELENKQHKRVVIEE